MKRIEILVADDHPVFRNGICKLLEELDDAIRICGTAESGAETLKLLGTIPRCDVVLLDICMEDMDGIETAQMIKARYPATKIVMLTTFQDPNHLRLSMNTGVDGFITKSASETEILDVIRKVQDGFMMISKEAAKVLNEMSTGRTTVADRDPILSGLSPREQEVFYLMIHRKTNPEIADYLSISEHTVRNYVTHIYSAVGAGRRSELIAWAAARGYIHGGGPG